MSKSGRDIFTKSEKLAQRLDDVVAKLAAEFNPEKIILFGSFARGDYKKTSTMDLLVIANTDLRFTDRIKRALEVCKGGPKPPIEPLVYTPEEYKAMLEEAQEAFLHDALSEGIVVYEK